MMIPCSYRYKFRPAPFASRAGLIPQGLKPPLLLLSTARLKSCPPKILSKLRSVVTVAQGVLANDRRPTANDALIRLVLDLRSLGRRFCRCGLLAGTWAQHLFHADVFALAGEFG